jgi:alkanesulfonate monooxygenase SsuD/methylene tetrahydromethanopterin reductase-like flavin-dependent oxidoreductase (luciferase family)
MGARAKNFYNEVAKHLGYEKEAAKIQDAYLSGRRGEAIAAVPDALVDETSLVGSPDRIRERLQAWKDAGARHEVGSMLLSGVTIASLRVAAEAVL